MPKSRLNPVHPGTDPLPESMRLLELALAQITHALQESDDSMQQLGQSFTLAMDELNKVPGVAASLNSTAAHDPVLNACHAAIGQLQQAVVALQSYDRLAQRLQHVAADLDGLGTLLGDVAARGEQTRWRELHEQIRERCTVEAERCLVHAVLGGANARQAVQQLTASNPAPSNDVELF